MPVSWKLYSFNTGDNTGPNTAKQLESKVPHDPIRII